jgi:transcription elongation GreA/GreB family factor
MTTNEQINEAVRLAEAIGSEIENLLKEFAAKEQRTINDRITDIRDAAAGINVLTAAQWHFARKSEKLRQALAETSAG